MRKLVGAVGIENNIERNFKDLEEMLENARVLIRPRAFDSFSASIVDGDLLPCRFALSPVSGLFLPRIFLGTASG